MRLYLNFPLRLVLLSALKMISSSQLFQMLALIIKSVNWSEGDLPLKRVQQPSLEFMCLNAY